MSARIKLALFLAAFVAFALLACDGSYDGKPPTPDTAAHQRRVESLLNVFPATGDDTFNQSYQEGTR